MMVNVGVSSVGALAPSTRPTRTGILPQGVCAACWCERDGVRRAAWPVVPHSLADACRGYDLKTLLGTYPREMEGGWANSVS